MRLITTKVYFFDELSENAQKVALEKNNEINFDIFDWWESTFEDAKYNSSLDIKSFDIDRRNYCNVSFIVDAANTANTIIENHGKSCETFKVAQKYLKRKKHTDETNQAFLENLSELYLKTLKVEHEYLGSNEAIKETIIANEFEFTESGKLFI